MSATAIHPMTGVVKELVRDAVGSKDAASVLAILDRLDLVALDLTAADTLEFELGGELRAAAYTGDYGLDMRFVVHGPDGEVLASGPAHRSIAYLKSLAR